MSPTVATQPVYTKRSLILHDAFTFFTLSAVSIALFGITLLLFRSFEDHRVDLAHRWAQRGRLALDHDHPDEAVRALRTALSYTPDGPEAHDEQLLLAQSLAAAGHTDEATNYYLNLWSSHPGDGLINLELARLSRVRHEDNEATDYYRAAVYGSWEGDAVPRRRETRLELTDFLIEQHRNPEARNELFVLAGNTPADEKLDILVAEKLENAGYPTDAITFYEKAAKLDPHDRVPLRRAGEASYRLGDYAQAESFLRRALEVKSAAKETSAEEAQLTQLAEDAQRMQQLSLNPSLPPHDRALHIAADEKIAQARLRACLASTAGDNDLTGILARWTALQTGPKPGVKPGPKVAHRTLLEDPADQNNVTHLIYDTEQTTAGSCGAPAGDDALLLTLANAAQPPAAPASAPAPVSAPVVPSLSRFFGRKEASDNGK